MVMKCTCTSFYKMDLLSVRRKTKANHKNKAKGKIKEDFDSSSVEEECDVVKLALMVRKTREMLKILNKKGIKFDSKKDIGSKSKSLFELNC